MLIRGFDMVNLVELGVSERGQREMHSKLCCEVAEAA